MTWLDAYAEWCTGLAEPQDGLSGEEADVKNQIRANGDPTVTKTQNSGRQLKTIRHKKIQSPLSGWIF